MTAPQLATDGLTPRERRARGRAVRVDVPLAAHAEVGGGDGSGRDPVTLLEEQAAGRVPELVRIRYGRMLASSFAFFRGAARTMAVDLADTPQSGLIVQMCGDAHLANFGIFGSPERRLVFDVNDFDETQPGPFEYDVKRLMASLAVAGRQNGFSAKTRRAVISASATRYRTAMAGLAAMPDIDVWYARIDEDDLRRQVAPLLDPARRKRLEKALVRARTRNHAQAFRKLTEVSDGHRRIRADPPLLVPLHDLLSADGDEDFGHRIRGLLGQYRRSLQADRRALVERYRFVDMARKVVGVGSVGLRCWVVLLLGRDDDDPLLLQVKEAAPSVYADRLPTDRHANEGHRVVAGQRLMQQASDIFLGWQRSTGIDDLDRDFYVRQLRDWKGSVSIEALEPEAMQAYGQLCAWSLARAHARTGDRIAIAGYLGSSEVFNRALVEFAEAYADRTEQDHRALASAAVSGRVQAETGV